MKRSLLARKTPLRRSAKRLKRSRLNPKCRTRASYELVYGELSDFLDAENKCQADGFAPGPCGMIPGRYRLERCHALTKGAGHGAWVVRFGRKVGNLFIACPIHHDWCDNHKAQSLTWMQDTAEANGERFVVRAV